MSKQKTFKAFLLVMVLLFLIGVIYYKVTDRQNNTPSKSAQLETLVIAPTPPVITEPVVIKPIITPEPVKIVKPIASPTKVQEVKKLIIDYSLNLNYSETTANSIANAKLALDIINGKNGYLLRSGETFSFNNVVGVRSYSRGFVNAPLIKGNGVGGGVCKSSTAIYQAAHKAGLNIIEDITIQNKFSMQNWELMPWLALAWMIMYSKIIPTMTYYSYVVSTRILG